jgi:GT2 family glycosyltransferase
MKVNEVKASIVTVTWNGKALVDECIGSLCRQLYDIPAEIIVVDNASTDGTADLIHESFPEIRLIRNEQNLGFARANNQGIRLTRGRYICLINSDVNAPAGCLKKMVTYMDENPAIGVLGPKMLGPNGEVGQSVMRFPSLWNSLLRAFALDSLFKGSRAMGGQLMGDFRYDTVTDVDVLTGWFWVVRREALEKVGLLDEDFFMYGEDIDWCKRFRHASWRVVFYPEAEALHYGGASSAKAPSRFYVELLRARMQYCRKHYSLPMCVGFGLAAWIHHLVRIIGYGALYLLKPSGRLHTSSKIKRSVACVRWLMGFRPLAMEEA